MYDGGLQPIKRCPGIPFLAMRSPMPKYLGMLGFESLADLKAEFSEEVSQTWDSVQRSAAQSASVAASS